MATMSYCAIENTHGDMGSALEQMEKFVNGDDLNEYERRHMVGLANGCIEYLQLFLSAVQDERVNSKHINFEGIRELALQLDSMSDEELNKDEE